MTTSSSMTTSFFCFSCSSDICAYCFLISCFIRNLLCSNFSLIGKVDEVSLESSVYFLLERFYRLFGFDLIFISELFSNFNLLVLSKSFWVVHYESWLYRMLSLSFLPVFLYDVNSKVLKLLSYA